MMDAKTQMPRPNPHAPVCAVLSVGTPTLIAAALRAGRRGADAEELEKARAPLATLADRSPAAAIVVAWLDAKLAKARAFAGAAPMILAKRDSEGFDGAGVTCSDHTSDGTTEPGGCVSQVREVQS